MERRTGGILKETRTSGVRAEGVQINRVMVANGTLNYKNRATGATLKIENLNLPFPRHVAGPYPCGRNMKYVIFPFNVERQYPEIRRIFPVPVSGFLCATVVDDLPHVELSGVL